MPAIRSKELEELLEQKRFRRVVIKKNHDIYYLIVYDLEGQPQIHCNKNGRHKEYRHLEQPLEWLQRKFGLTDVEVE
jgi:hypothetical protein